MKATVIESPIGPLLSLVDGRGRLRRLDLPKGRTAAGLLRDAGNPDRDDRASRHVARQLDQYFAGKLTEFDLETAPEGTPFQRSVWRMLERIPYGETWSYGELARRLKRPGAARAVGHANGTNPIAIVIPCHRVIGSNGTLTGYGGGLEAKRRLLELEGAWTGSFSDSGASSLVSANGPVSHTGRKQE